MAEPHIEFVYMNYKNEVAIRRARPLRVYYGESEWYDGETYLMECWDIDKGALRTFALCRMHVIRVVNQHPPGDTDGEKDGQAHVGRR